MTTASRSRASDHPAGKAACKFTVEEYKRPEFEVTVQPPKTAQRLGDVIAARVTARYYFGAPVAGGKVQYKVLRRPHRLRYAIPSDWDWLYGNGYGSYDYDDPWVDGGDMQEEGSQEEADETRHIGDQVAASGTATLNSEGWADLRIDTSQDPRDSDQEYRISVSVLDESRRTVEGEGTVVATRQAAFAFVEMDGGWYGRDASGSRHQRALGAEFARRSRRKPDAVPYRQARRQSRFPADRQLARADGAKRPRTRSVSSRR